MFVDYDGVVKTYAENFPYELHDENMPSSMSMIRVLSNIAGLLNPGALPSSCSWR